MARWGFPHEDTQEFGVDEITIASRTFTSQIRELMLYEADSTRQMFAKGMPFNGIIDCGLPPNREVFSRGNLEILNAIEQQNYDVLRARPLISQSGKAALLLRAQTGTLPGRNLAQAAGSPTT